MHLPEARVRVYPTLFQAYLRRVVVRTGDEVRVGAITMWDPGPVAWHRFTIPEHPMIERLADTKAGRIFQWFASGELAPRLIDVKDEFIVEFDDLRYGLPERPEQGLWGIRGRFDREGNRVGDVVRFRREVSVRREAFASLWNAIFSRAPRIEITGESDRPADGPGEEPVLQGG